MADKQQLMADGQDLAFVTVELVDADGTPFPLANDQLTFRVSGAGFSQSITMRVK